jgi:hypothetical protein
MHGTRSKPKKSGNKKTVARLFEQRSARNRRYEECQRTGCYYVKIKMNHVKENALESSRWLDRRDTHQRSEVEAALQRMLDASLR